MEIASLNNYATEFYFYPSCILIINTVYNTLNFKMMFKDVNAFSSFAVNNISEAKKFYNQVLGLQINDEMQGLISLQLAGGSKILIYPKPNHAPATFTVLNFPVADIEKAVADLTALGVEFEKYNEPNLKTDEKGISHGKPLVAWFRDPSGNILSVMEQIANP